MDLLGIMKENIELLTMGQKMLGSLIVMVIGMATCLIALTVLIYCIRLMSVAFNKKDDPNNKSATKAQPLQPAAKSGTTPSVPIPKAQLASESEDEGELVAVMTAAITALSGSANFAIRSIRENVSGRRGSNWATTGRFMAFESRKVTKK